MTAACMAAEPGYTWRTVLLSILVAIVPLAGSAPYTLLKALVLLVLLVTGIVLIRRQPDVRLRYRIARFVVIVCFLRLAYAFYSITWHDLRWNELDLPAQTLLYLGTAAVFATVLDWRLIWKILALSTLVFGGSCIVQHHVLGLERAHGFSGGEWTAIEFTMVTLCMALFSVIRLIQPNVHPAERWLHGVAIAVGVYGSILAQSRGPILAFIPAMLMVIAVHVRRTRRWRGALAFVGALVIGVVGATTMLNHEVIQRFGEVSGEITGFNQENEVGSVRERIAMWGVAVDAFAEHPVAGVGLNQFGTYAREGIARGEVSDSIFRYNHPHNEYLEAAATGGVPLLVIMLLVFILPGLHFVRRVGHADETTAMIATAGLAVVIVYALSAFTDNVFYRAMPHSFYFYLVLGFMLATALPARDVRRGGSSC